MQPSAFWFRRLWRCAAGFIVAGAAVDSGLFAAESTARLIGLVELRRDATADGTRCGGLSGIDYDAAGAKWIAVSDDKGEYGPPRVYHLAIDYDAEAVRSASIQSMDPLTLPAGVAYDLESLRLDPIDGTLWLASEGDARSGKSPAVVAGTQLFALPPEYRYDPAGKTGPPPNRSVEGLCFSVPGNTVWTSIEAPLLQDEPTMCVRITEQRRTGEIVRQLAYALDPVPADLATGRLPANGVSEIFAIAPERLLVLERAGAEFGEGRWRFAVKLFEVDLRGAEPLDASVPFAAQKVSAVRKRLLYDFANSGQRVDNLEGLARGRRLANGHETLVLVSDDNFLPAQSTQLWVLELPAVDAAPRKREWDDPFEGVVHDDKRIAGFVGEYRWLSNYFPCPVTYDGRAYGSSEAAYHASKYPESERAEFTKLDPDASKKRSRQKGVDQAWWDERKERVMREIAWAKFSQNRELADWLLATGDRRLEEANWWGDKFWGTVNGEGRNVLGQLLMETRDRLRHEREAKR